MFLTLAIRNGRARELVVTKPEHIYDFYKGDTKHHPKPPYLDMGKYFSGILGHAVGAIAGERWSMIRRYFDPEFSSQSARQAIPQLSASTNRWLDELHCMEQERKKGFLLDRGADKRMEEFRSRWREFNLGIIQAAREASKVCPAERIYRGVEKGDLKLEEFLHTLNEILFANVDVSSAVLNTLFEHLAANTAIQQKLRGEVEAHSQNTLLNFAVMEAMCLSPAFAFSLPECTAVSKEIWGYRVPARCPVVIDAKRLNADSATWGKDGDTYRPERFRDIPPSKSRLHSVQDGPEVELRDVNVKI
ncbi:cytochrome P450 [Aspergillus navahoensis]